jgi:hypothetical protein
MDRTLTLCAAATLATALLVPAEVFGQQGSAGPPPTPRAGASADLTGLWVSVVTEDWLYRMVTPAKGDRRNVPLNAAGIAATNEWDPAKDEAAGAQCKAYGAVGAMRQPGRLRISWADDATLKVEAEAGNQTRLLRFAGAAPLGDPAQGEATWQGDSVASWEYPGGRLGRGPVPQHGALKVVTRRMRPGYLQKNGVPYGANAVLTEYFHRTTEPNGDTWLVVIAVVDDPQYLNGPFVRSSNFKKLPDTATWEPEACSSR